MTKKEATRLDILTNAYLVIINSYDNDWRKQNKAAGFCYAISRDIEFKNDQQRNLKVEMAALMPTKGVDPVTGEYTNESDNPSEVMSIQLSRKWDLYSLGAIELVDLNEDLDAAKAAYLATTGEKWVPKPKKTGRSDVGATMADIAKVLAS